MFQQIFIIVFFVFVLCSCHKTEKTLTIIDGMEVSKASISENTDFLNSAIGDLIFTPLVYIDWGERHNVLAEDIKVSPDRKAVEVKLRDGVKFHDGKKLTAKDMASSIEMIKDIDSSVIDKYGDINVDVIDSSRIRLYSDLELSISNFNNLLSMIYAFPQTFKNLNGTGPFKFKRWLDNGLELVANEDYFEGRPKLDKIIYIYEEDERKRLYAALDGKADLLIFISPEVVDFLEKDGKFHIVKTASENYSALFLNNQSFFFSDGAVRRAINLAIDRDSLIENALRGAGIKASGPFPQTPLSKENRTADYEPREAVKLLKSSGWSDTDGDGILEKNGKRFRFKFYYTTMLEENKKIADIIGRYLFEVGIEAEGVPMSDFDFNKMRQISGDYDAMLACTDSTDTYLFNYWHSSSIKNIKGNNYSRYADNGLDILLLQLREADNPDTRKQIYGRMQQIMDRDVPAVFLYHSLNYSAISKKFKRGEEFFGNIYSVYKIKDWSVNERVN